MTELVRNGSFDAGLLNWVSDAQNAGTISTAVNPAGNTYLTGHLADTSGSNTVSQTFTIGEHVSNASVAFAYHLSNNIKTDDAFGLFIVQLANVATGESIALLVLDGVSGTRDENFSLDFTSSLNSLSAGTYSLIFTEQAYGSGADFDFTLDNVSINITTFSPAPVVVRVLDDTNYTDDNVTSDTTPSLTITGEAGGTVEVFRNGVSVGTVTDVGTPGEYTFNSALLADGNYTFTARLTLPGAPQSAASAPLAVTIDHIAPDAPTIVDVIGNTITITAETGSNIVLYNNGEYMGRAYETSTKGTFKFVLESSANGAVVYTGSATDLAGNVSELSIPFVVDTVPVITSNGGSDTATVHVAENISAVTTISATDANGNATLTYSIIGGEDRAKFEIDSSTGALSFVDAPDYEQPGSGAASNEYDVIVQASDGHLAAQQQLTVVVDDVASENVRGSVFNEILVASNDDSKMYGFAGNDTLRSGDGNDRLDGGIGTDTMMGGAGNDIYFVENAGDRIVETTDGGTDTAFTKVNLTLSDNIEQLTQQGRVALIGIGNALANRITGNSGANALYGLEGNDRIVGGSGDDRIYGGLGRDTLTGGTGSDQFVFEAPRTGDTTITSRDKITDFSHSQRDHIVLDQSFFTAFTSLGGISADAFYAAEGARSAHDATDRLIYNKTSGALYYDADGHGGAAAIYIATLSGHPELFSSDFLIVA